MTTLLSLIGEQPIPNLLPVRALKPAHNVLACTRTTRRVADNLRPLIPGAEVCEVEAYDLTRALEDLRPLCGLGTVINLTGGTKPMALAAYEAARSACLPIVYLQTEGGQGALYRYDFQNGQPVLRSRDTLGALVTIDDYLLAHGIRPVCRTGPTNPQEAGLRQWLEKRVDECRSNLVFEAFEVDFVLRRGNRVAVVEAKMKKVNSRRGIDQLNTIAGRAYLGTYTGKIWLIAQPLGAQLRRLAEARQIEVVVVNGTPDRRTGRLLLDADSRARLSAALDKVLGARSPREAPR